MNKILLSACIMAVISLSSCSQQPEHDSSLPKSPAPAVVAADTQKVVVKDTAIRTVIKTNQQPLPATGSTARNPKHGDPGHRCDIAVGALLNSPAQPVQQNVPVITPSPTQPAVLSNPGGTVKLNPPHGQPGHDCAIPVGKPLKG